MTGPELFRRSVECLANKAAGENRVPGRTTFVNLPADLREVAKFCRDDLACDYCSISPASIILAASRDFEIVYELYR